MSDGFVVGPGAGALIGAGSAHELIHKAIDAMLDGAPVGAMGVTGECEVPCPDGSSHLHTIRLAIMDVTNQEPCAACAGTGVANSEEIGGVGKETVH